MKTIIYYFTGTGNSLAIARDIAEELHDSVEVVSIAQLIKEESINIESDVVGIVYPAWLHSIPPIVEEFAKKLILYDSYVFGICTYFIDPSNALFDMNTILEQKGSKLAAGFLIKMPGKYVLVKDLTSSDEENKRRFIEEQKKIKEIAKIVKERIYAGIEGHFDKNEKGEIRNYHKNVYKVAEKFWVTDKCNLCSICIKICPRNNIEIMNNKVLWKDNCDYCLACLHWCPQTAIQNGDISSKSRRYHHPDISLKDIINQSNIQLHVKHSGGTEHGTMQN